MPKEKSFNPAAAQRKADKQREIAKGKRQVQAQRNEKLARRNPERLQRQIDELKELEERGVLRPKDRETLTQLEKDVRGIRRAREALGDKAPTFPSSRDGGRRGDDGARKNARQEQLERRQQQQQQSQQHLGKRRRHDDDEVISDEDLDPEVLNIPMPRDTPPPFPRREQDRTENAPRGPHALPAKPVTATVPSKKVYSAAPQIRNLQKEAVRFMPSSVAAQKNRVHGQGRLLEPEEADKLEKSGYIAAQKAAEEAEKESSYAQAQAAMKMQGGEADMDAEARRLEEEIGQIYSGDAAPAESGVSKRHAVEMEEVEDDGD